MNLALKISLVSKNIKYSNVIFNNIRTMSLSTDILAEKINNKGLITLNRPKAMNAFTHNMIKKLKDAAEEWESQCDFIIAKGAGDKAFSAGGDIRTLVNIEKYGSNFYDLFRDNYQSLSRIQDYKIPYIALWNGIVMGGGFGISASASHRVATERTILCMPEVGIGLFPDVGASHYLNRLPGKLGLFLGLTGTRLVGKDAFASGYATHYTDSKNLQNIERDLLDLENAKGIDAVLEKHCTKPVDHVFSLKEHLEKINSHFTANTMEKIFDNLENDKSQFAQNTLKSLRQFSPTSLKITKRQIETGAKLSFNACLNMEYRIMMRCMQDKTSDFYEGVRALLVDKDKKPKWNPSTLEKVSDEKVDSFFAKLPPAIELNLVEQEWDQLVHSKL